jgi:hypothetical protein
MKRCITYSNRLQLKRPIIRKGTVLHEKRPALAAPNPRQSTTPAYKYEVVNRLRGATDTNTSRSKLTIREAAFAIETTGYRLRQQNANYA